MTEKGIDASTVEQLLKEMENLKIAMVKKSDDRRTSSKYTDRRCIWCDSTEHDRRDCDEHKEALRRGKSDPFDGLSEATPTEVPERWHEEGPRGGISGEKQLCDNRGNTCWGVIGSKVIGAYTLCQLHEVYVDEKRRCTDEAAGPSKTPESWNSRGKGKEKKIPAFKLT